MNEVAAPDTIIKILDAIRTQIDVITTLSSGGTGLIIFTWARILGIFDDANFSGFKRPFFLLLPAILFIFSIIVGYLSGAQTTGYYIEIANGVNASTGTKIDDARAYFFSDYNVPFHWMMALQLYSSVLGIISLSGWFAWNIFNIKGDK